MNIIVLWLHAFNDIYRVKERLTFTHLISVEKPQAVEKYYCATAWLNEIPTIIIYACKFVYILKTYSKTVFLEFTYCTLRTKPIGIILCMSVCQPVIIAASLSGLQEYYIIMNVLVLCYVDFIIASRYEDCSIGLKCRTHLNYIIM